MSIKIVPITDFIRNFGVYSDLLSKIDKLILTREGRPFATIKATPEEKNKKLLSFAGIFNGTKLEDEKFWKNTLKRKSRKEILLLK